MSTTTTTPAAPLNEFQVIEADVMAFVTKVVNEVEVLTGECVTALENVAALVPQASTWIEDAIAFVEGIPVVGQNPAVLATVAAVDLATKGLDAFAATMTQAQSAGGSVTVTQASAAVIAGVTAYNTAKAAAANMTNAAVTSAPAAAVLIPPAAS